MISRKGKCKDEYEMIVQECVNTCMLPLKFIKENDRVFLIGENNRVLNPCMLLKIP